MARAGSHQQSLWACKSPQPQGSCGSVCAHPQRAALLPQDSLPNLQEPVWLKSRPMGMFQPAVLPTAVWQDFLPFREFQANPVFDFLTTATARYPGTTEEQVLIPRGLAYGLWCRCLQLRPKQVKEHHQQ